MTTGADLIAAERQRQIAVTVVPGIAEVAEGDAVQVRVRLHADDDAKAAVA